MGVEKTTASERPASLLDPTQTENLGAALRKVINNHQQKSTPRQATKHPAALPPAWQPSISPLGDRPLEDGQPAIKSGEDFLDLVTYPEVGHGTIGTTDGEPGSADLFEAKMAEERGIENRNRKLYTETNLKVEDTLDIDYDNFKGALNEKLTVDPLLNRVKSKAIKNTPASRSFTDLWVRPERSNARKPSNNAPSVFIDRSQDRLLADKADYLDGASFMQELEAKGRIKFEGSNADKVRQAIIRNINGSAFFRHALQDGVAYGRTILLTTDPAKRNTKNPNSIAYSLGSNTDGARMIWLEESLLADDKVNLLDIVVGHEFGHATIGTADGDPGSADLFEAKVAEERGIEDSSRKLYRKSDVKIKDNLDIDYEKFKDEMNKTSNVKEIIQKSK